MQTLKYSIQIKAPKAVVWDSMMDPQKYRTWTKAFSANSQYFGEWKQGHEIQFYDPNMGGTVARLEKLTPYELVVAKHIATLTKDREIETTGPMTENWVGTLETYKLSESQGMTTLDVEMETHPDFAGMFESSWPQALHDLKKMIES